eukprot:PhF_6_TR33656/c0_g1_i2/m.49246
MSSRSQPDLLLIQMVRFINELEISKPISHLDEFEGLRSGTWLCDVMDRLFPHSIPSRHVRPTSKILCEKNIQQALNVLWRNTCSYQRVEAEQIYEGNLHAIGIVVEKIFLILFKRIAKEIKQRVL